MTKSPHPDHIGPDLATTELVKLLQDTTVAEQLGVEPGTLAVWRSTGRYALPWVKIGRRVFYRTDDVNAFIAGRVQGGQRDE